MGGSRVVQFFLTKHLMANAVPNCPLLLLLDGIVHISKQYLCNWSKNTTYIVDFCLLLHTTHVHQPLYCSFFKPLKEHWREECHKFYQKYPGLVISKFNFYLFGEFQEAWLNATSPSKFNVIAGFKGLPND